MLHKTNLNKQIFIICLLNLLIILCGCGMTQEEQENLKVANDQFEEALRYNYTKSYIAETDIFSRILIEMVECETGNQAEICHLKGKISGLYMGCANGIYQRTYNLCIDKIQDSRVPDEMRAYAGKFSDAYWGYISFLNDLSEDEFSQLLQDKEFESLCRQLRGVIDKYLVIDLSTDIGDQRKLFLENVEVACEFLSQLESMVGT